MVYPQAHNVTSFKTLFQYCDTVSDGWFSVGMLLTLFIILAVSLSKGKNPSKGIATAAFVTSLITIFMRLMGLINNLVLIIAIIIFFASAFMLFSEE